MSVSVGGLGHEVNNVDEQVSSNDHQMSVTGRG